MLVRPRCAQCTNRASWLVRLYLHGPGEGRKVDLCGTHVKPFRAQRCCHEWTVTDLARVAYIG